MLLVLLPGCASMANIIPTSHGRASLEAGINNYADGRYTVAEMDLRTALDQGLNKDEQASAHKYLAFIDCVTNKIGACRSEFSRALAIDPAMELSAAEAGHPIWGPVFQSVKKGRH
jgi:hypothetical protein